MTFIMDYSKLRLLLISLLIAGGSASTTIFGLGAKAQKQLTQLERKSVTRIRFMINGTKKGLKPLPESKMQTFLKAKGLDGFYIAVLRHEENELMNVLRKRYQVLLDIRFNSSNKSREFQYGKHSKKKPKGAKKDKSGLNSQCRECISKAYRDFGLSSGRHPLRFIRHKKNRQDRSYTDGKRIYIDKMYLSRFNKQEFLSVIGHEMSHIKNKDVAVSDLLLAHNEFCSRREQVPDALLGKCSRFSETRADIQSALKGTDYAQGGISSFKRWVQGNKRKKLKEDNSTHPYDSQRLELFNLIAAQQTVLAKQK